MLNSIEQVCDTGAIAGAAIEIVDDIDVAPTERRTSSREIAIFRPCCVEDGTRAQLGLIRNMSEDGALIETDLDIDPGEELRYFWESLPAIEAKVAWRRGNKIGVRNMRHGRPAPAAHPYRCVRIPCDKVAQVWTGGEAIEGWVVNISLTGMLVFGLDELPVGKPISAKLGDQVFENATVRWSELGSVGVRFDTPLAPRQLMRILR